MENSDKQKDPKFKKVAVAAYDLSLGISIVIAILIGIGVGYLLREAFGYEWLLWLGVFWGVAAGGLNIYKAYKRQIRELDDLNNDPRRKPRKREE